MRTTQRGVTIAHDLKHSQGQIKMVSWLQKNNAIPEPTNYTEWHCASYAKAKGQAEGVTGNKKKEGREKKKNA